MRTEVLLADERSDRRERLTVKWIEEDGRCRLDISIERRSGDAWVRAYGVTLSPGEVFRLHDAAGMATWLARQVRR